MKTCFIVVVILASLLAGCVDMEMHTCPVSGIEVMDLADCPPVYTCWDGEQVLAMEDCAPEINKNDERLEELTHELEVVLNQIETLGKEQKTSEAASKTVDAIVLIAEAEVLVPKTSYTDEYKQDLGRYFSSRKRLMSAVRILMESEEIILEKGMDKISLDEYKKVVAKLHDAKKEISEARVYALEIEDDVIREEINITDITEGAEYLDLLIEVYESDEAYFGVIANSFTQHIDPVDPKVREVAAGIEKEYGNEQWGKIFGVIYYISDNLDYIHQPNWNPEGSIQNIQSPAETIELGGGNCADISILASSIMESLAISTSFCFVDTLHTPAEVERRPALFSPNHAALAVFDRIDGWIFFDPTCYAGVDYGVGMACENYVIQTGTWSCIDVEIWRELMKEIIEESGY